MIEMFVGEHHAVDVPARLAQDPQVGAEETRVATGVEKQGLRQPLDDAGESPVGPQASLAAEVVVDHRDTNAV